jgi:hypothetical protein
MGTPVGDQAETVRRGLSAARLRRLLEISALVRRNPRLRMADILKQLAISRSQFYRDREELLRLGLHFGRSGRARGFTLDQDPLLPPVSMAVSELLALSSAVAALARAGQAEAAYLGLRSLLAVTGRLPESARAALEPFVEEVVLGEGFGCPLAVLEVLERAAAEGRRIVIRRALPGGAEPSYETLTLDPLSIAPLAIAPLAIGAAEAGGLALTGYSERGERLCVPLAEIEEAGFTPFLVPEPPPEQTPPPQGEK